MSTLAILWIILAAGGALLIVALRRLDRKRPKVLGHSHVDELHHGYIGGLVALGILLALTVPRIAAIAIAIFGLVLLVEDVIAHFLESVKRYGWRGLFWRIYRWFLTR